MLSDTTPTAGDTNSSTARDVSKTDEDTDVGMAFGVMCNELSTYKGVRRVIASVHGDVHVRALTIL